MASCSIPICRASQGSTNRSRSRLSSRGPSFSPRSGLPARRDDDPRTVICLGRTMAFTISINCFNDRMCISGIPSFALPVSALRQTARNQASGGCAQNRHAIRQASVSGRSSPASPRIEAVAIAPIARAERLPSPPISPASPRPHSPRQEWSQLCPQSMGKDSYAPDGGISWVRLTEDAVQFNRRNQRRNQCVPVCTQPQCPGRNQPPSDPQRRCFEASPSLVIYA